MLPVTSSAFLEKIPESCSGIETPILGINTEPDITNNIQCSFKKNSREQRYGYPNRVFEQRFLQIFQEWNPNNKQRTKAQNQLMNI